MVRSLQHRVAKQDLAFWVAFLDRCGTFRSSAGSGGGIEKGLVGQVGMNSGWADGVWRFA